MLYKRNYFELNSTEKTELDKAEIFLLKLKNKKTGWRVSDIMKYHELIPEAGYHYKSLFPNNYLRYDYKKNNINIEEQFENFKKLVQNKISDERRILNFIKNNQSYFILESLFFKFSTGNHDGYLFREFELPPNYIVDFLLVGKSSSGFEFIFIEFESPNKEITLKDGSLGNGFRKGIKQIEDWDSWLDSNFSLLRNVFKKYQNLSKELPSEFYEYDKSRIHYLVIAGKREHFNEKTYKIKRKGVNNIKIMHYDNLIDTTELYVNTKLKK